MKIYISLYMVLFFLLCLGCSSASQLLKENLTETNNVVNESSKLIAVLSRDNETLKARAMTNHRAASVLNDRMPEDSSAFGVVGETLQGMGGLYGLAGTLLLAGGKMYSDKKKVSGYKSLIEDLSNEPDLKRCEALKKGIV